MTATTTTSGLIQTGTTKLYHEVRGSGPALLITGGTGDAGEWATPRAHAGRGVHGGDL